MAGRGLSEIVETGRRRRNTGEVNLSETVAKTLLTRRRVRRSSMSEDEEYGDQEEARARVRRSSMSEDEEYGDYADYDGEQDYPASNTSYEDSPEVTIPLLLLA